MKPRNFPGRVHARRMKALAEAERRQATPEIQTLNALLNIADPRQIRTKKNRRSLTHLGVK